MSEIELTDEQANALHGTTDADTDFRYHSPGDAGYFTEGQRQRHRLLTIAKAISNSLRVYRDGELTFGVRPGRVRNGDACCVHSGIAGVALTDDATNCVYMTAADLAAGDSVSVSTDGFPAQSVVPHTPLAEIDVAGGVYGPDDISDRRGLAAFALGSAMSAEDANALVAGVTSNADALHVHSVAGLQAAVRALMPVASVTGIDNGDGTAVFTIQITDAEGGALSGKHFIRVWTSNGDRGEPVPSATAFDSMIGFGTETREVEAEVEYEMITNSGGLVKRMVTVPSDGTYWVTVQIGPHLRSAGVAITGA